MNSFFFQLFMEDARIKVEIVSADIPKVELDTFDQTYNDGNWHTVELAMSTNKAILTIDSEPMETKRILNIATGPYYMIGTIFFRQIAMFNSSLFVTEEILITVSRRTPDKLLSLSFLTPRPALSSCCILS